jgi:hypothetical protein
MRPDVENTRPNRSASPVVRSALASFQDGRRLGPSASRLADLALGDPMLSGDVLGVDPEHYIRIVTRALRNLSGRDSAVEPCREVGVSQVVRAPCQR